MKELDSRVIIYVELDESRDNLWVVFKEAVNLPPRAMSKNTTGLLLVSAILTTCPFPIELQITLLLHSG